MQSQTRMENDAKINEYICGHVQEHRETFNENHIRDFVDLYIQVSCDSKDGELETFTKGNMLRVILDLFQAG